MAYSACSLEPPGSGRQDRSSSAPPFLTRFLSGSHISAVFAHFSGLSPLFGSLVAYPVGKYKPKKRDVPPPKPFEPGERFEEFVVIVVRPQGSKLLAEATPLVPI